MKNKLPHSCGRERIDKMDEKIKRFMAEEIGKGVSLSEVQKLVNEKFDKSFTFMEIRIMASELEGIDWGASDPEEKSGEKEEKAGEQKENSASGAADEGSGMTTVEVSKLVRPGMMFSGTVKFGSGVSAEWYVDSRGRLGLDEVKGGEPTEQDIREFQDELRRVLQ